MLEQWAKDWNIPPQAVQDLHARMVREIQPSVSAAQALSETAVQTNIRLEASKQGIMLLRNNVGVLRDLRGVPVRYGLANESKAQNARLKSSDLIGIRRVLITPQHVGTTIGQFVSIEVKKQNWKWRGGEHELAQLRWNQLVNSYGGYGIFANSHEGIF